ncbi:MAG: lysine 2,3-aminomutase [Desulfobulbaceae bacterium A2]|nr:MAG: lysine 2,3-aminomutase [Desulfobulbaceae bacterium A2]
MANWQQILQQSLTSPHQLADRFPIETSELEQVTAHYPMRINPYYLELIRQTGDPLWRQAVPDPRELRDAEGLVDPLGEEDLSPVPNLVHKYPDRALFLVSNQCAMYCRFCTRKRKVGSPTAMVVSRDTIAAGLDYLRRTPTIREVLLSGGDPLLLADEQLDELLSALRAIPSIEVLRIGSRVPCTLPMRVTPGLVAVLKRHHPLYLNTHFNHPAELTEEATQACTMLADAGIPLGCQTVLLRGVNDDAGVLRKLLLGLLRLRVKPYYLFQADLCRGACHFRTPLARGLEIMRRLSGHISGMALPAFALDAPGGGGKIRLSPDEIVRHGNDFVFRNFRDRTYRYPDADDVSP